MPVSVYGLGEDLAAFGQGFGIGLSRASVGALDRVFRTVVVSHWREQPCNPNAPRLREPDSAPLRPCWCATNIKFLAFFSGPSGVELELNLTTPAGRVAVGLSLAASAKLVRSSRFLPAISRQLVCPRFCASDWVQGTVRFEATLVLSGEAAALARLSGTGLPLLGATTRATLRYASERYSVRHTPRSVRRILDG